MYSHLIRRCTGVSKRKTIEQKVDLKGSLDIAILRGALQHSGQEVRIGIISHVDQRFYILSQALKYRGEILGILRLLHSKCLSKRGFSYTGKLVASVMGTLTQSYPSENRFVNAEEWESQGTYSIYRFLTSRFHNLRLPNTTL
jgi:hypothetical protein